MITPTPKIVFLHGLEGSPDGFKATSLRAAFGDDRLIVPDMRDLPFDTRLVRALEAIHTITDGPAVVVGSSLGGWLAAIVAAVQPARVANLLLLVPAFREADVPTSSENAPRLRQLADATYASADVGVALPAMPIVKHKTRVVYATEDVVVSEARIHQWVKQTPTATIEGWPSDHLLRGHMDAIIARVADCLADCAPAP